VQIAQLTLSWCSISRTVWTNILMDQGGFPLRATINWSCSSFHTPAVHYIISQPQSPSIWSYSHPIASYLSYMLYPVLRTIFKSQSWGIYRYLQVIIEWVTSNLNVLFELNPAADSFMLQGIRTVQRLAVSWSDVDWFYTGIYFGKRQLNSLVW